MQRWLNRRGHGYSDDGVCGGGIGFLESLIKICWHVKDVRATNCSSLVGLWVATSFYADKA